MQYLRSTTCVSTKLKGNENTVATGVHRPPLGKGSCISGGPMQYNTAKMNCEYFLKVLKEKIK